MDRCEKHPNRLLSAASIPPMVCSDCRREERLKDCAQGLHYYAPARGIDGMRWCYGCGKTIDPDDFFREGMLSMYDKMKP